MSALLYFARQSLARSVRPLSFENFRSLRQDLNSTRSPSVIAPVLSRPPRKGAVEAARCSPRNSNRYERLRASRNALLLRCSLPSPRGPASQRLRASISLYLKSHDSDKHDQAITSIKHRAVACALCPLRRCVESEETCQRTHPNRAARKAQVARAIKLCGFSLRLSAGMLRMHAVHYPRGEHERDRLRRRTRRNHR